jgi:Family of unknown function (DUF6893)
MKLGISRRHRRAPIARAVASAFAVVATVLAARAFPELRRYLRIRSM